MSIIASSPLATFPIAAVPPTRKRWTRAEYYRLGEQGWFQDQRVELIDGEIIVLSPISPQHVAGSERLRRLLEKAFGEGYWVRQGPLPKDDYSEPEPDISVVRGAIEEFDEQHPTVAVLAVEVSKTTIHYDTHIKEHLYASMNVPDYWVLDLDRRQLNVYRRPIADVSASFGHRYEAIEVINDAGHISAIATPAAELAVSDMLPANSTKG